MRPRAVLVAAAIAGALLAASPALAGGTASAVLKDASGNEVGRATLTSTPSGALLNLTLTAAPPGVHALHIHAVGKCEPPKFESAGPHFNPDQTKHGTMNPEGPHAGDLPNLHIPADGKLQAEFLDPVVTLSQEAALLDTDGASIVIHAGADDYTTEPAGNAGDRIACGVITSP